MGSFLLSIKVTAAAREQEGLMFSEVCKRTLCAGLGLGLWPYTLWSRLDKKGRTWYDRASDCDVRLVDYK